MTIDQFNADKRGRRDQPRSVSRAARIADARFRPKPHALQRQWDQGDDHQRIEATADTLSTRAAP